MTPAQIELIQKSFGRIAPIAPLLSDLFYARLFQLAPELRPLFPTDMTAQKKKFIDTLATFVLFSHDFATVRDQIAAMGRRHSRYGALAEHYEIVGTALLATLAVALGANFTPDLRDAWSEGYATLAETMLAGAAYADAHSS